MEVRKIEAWREESSQWAWREGPPRSGKLRERIGAGRSGDARKCGEGKAGVGQLSGGDWRPEDNAWSGTRLSWRDLGKRIPGVYFRGA